MPVANLLNAVSANTTGPVVGFGSVYGNLTLVVSSSGTVSAFSVQLSGSNDSATWESIGSAVTSTTAGTSVGTGILFQYFQAVLSGYSGTGTVTVELAYSLAPSASGGGGPPTGTAGGDLSGTYPNPAVAKISGTAFSLPVSIANGGSGTGTAAPQNEVFAGPSSGVAGAPSFRSLVSGDVPTLNQNTSGSAGSLSATLGVASGGTGDASLTAYAPLAGGTTTTGAVQSVSTGLSTSGNVMTSNGSSALPSFQALPTDFYAAANYEGYASWTFDPLCAYVTSTATSLSSCWPSGFIVLTFLPTPSALTGLNGYISCNWRATSGGSPAGFYLGYYTLSGGTFTRQSVSSDQTSTSQSLLRLNIGPASTTSAGIWVAMLATAQGSTAGGPVMSDTTITIASQWTNATTATTITGIAGKGRCLVYNTGSQTSLLSSFALSGCVAHFAYAGWFGID